MGDLYAVFDFDHDDWILSLEKVSEADALTVDSHASVQC